MLTTAHGLDTSGCIGDNDRKDSRVEAVTFGLAL